MRRIGKLILALAILALMVPIAAFAVANRQTVAVDLWPFALSVELPVYLLSLGTLAFGLVVGALVFWLPLVALKRRHRGLVRRLDRQERAEAAVTQAPRSSQTLPATR